ncbi:MAG: bifunctional diaminohydroxyphosphoribosylaminopyrimidine deaminase/5-amino-6-(5-phosphoribosylamino)uracil reductase RibD [Gemmatimonadaceae bacterium]|nr:bifunctional diaminohydroxyphosphoribosylaminopyrimidine deaminase/5-amino-6-(5-phosphoribosylamino)uracil reductase RibD [Gemmatimonadaceae bacterium]
MSSSGRPVDERDRAFIRRTLDLALAGWGQTAPNPLVGAVVVRDGVVVGEGAHLRHGDLHAEPVALAHAGERARGATVYVSLEPCTHLGKTPPCTDALIAAGVARVVIATADPNPRAAGGAGRLRDAGIEVMVGVEEAAARELNAPFFFAHHSARPWITLKLAVSIDGALTDARRSSAWLTGPESRAEVHRMRANSDAIAVGAGTVLADDPLLTVRGALQPRVAPVRVVFDARLETPPDSRILQTAAGPGTVMPAPRTILLATRGASDADAARRAVLERAGADIIIADSLAAGLTALKERGIQSLLVEGGAAVAGALLEAAVVDRLVIFQAPIVLGQGAINAFSRAPASQVTTTARLPVVERRTLGDDLMTVYALTDP